MKILKMFSFMLDFPIYLFENFMLTNEQLIIFHHPEFTAFSDIMQVRFRHDVETRLYRINCPNRSSSHDAGIVGRKDEALMTYNPAIHHRRSIRLKGYDYTRAGAYYITICTQGRLCLFGEVVNGEMRLNEVGRIIDDTWRWLQDQYDYVEIAEYVVMPNHLHGIIVLCDDRDDPRRGGSRTAPTEIPTPFTPAKRKPVGRLIGAFKTVSTKHINEIWQTPGMTLWQRDFYEHIIRDEDDYQRIHQYILDNPLEWEKDNLYSKEQREW